jgi:hypothetical protein
MINKERKMSHHENDDRINVHNIDLLSMCRANVDYQLVFFHRVVLKYIAKYASKEEKR